MTAPVTLEPVEETGDICFALNSQEIEALDNIPFGTNISFESPDDAFQGLAGAGESHDVNNQPQPTGPLKPSQVDNTTSEQIELGKDAPWFETYQLSVEKAPEDPMPTNVPAVNKAKSGKWLRDGTLEALCECVRDHKTRISGYKATINWRDVTEDLKDRLMDVDSDLAKSLTHSGVKSKYMNLQRTMIATSRLAGTHRSDTGTGSKRWYSMSFQERKQLDSGFVIQLSKEQYENLEQYFVKNVKNTQSFGQPLQANTANKTAEVESIDEGEVEVTSPGNTPGPEQRGQSESGQDSISFINSARTKRKRSSEQLTEDQQNLDNMHRQKEHQRLESIAKLFDEANSNSTSQLITAMHTAVALLVQGLANTFGSDRNEAK